MVWLGGVVAPYCHFYCLYEINVPVIDVLCIKLISIRPCKINN